MRIQLVLLCIALLAGACADPNPGAGPKPTTTNSPDPGAGLAAVLDCARERGLTLLQAHRAGDRPGAAENSLDAIEASLADGALFMEVDVARTADDVLILMHDDTLDRTTTGSGEVEAFTYAQLSQLTLIDENGRDTGEPIPTLADALAVLDGRGIAQIDRKAPTTFDEIAAVIDAAGATDRVVMITYSLDDAIALHRRSPELLISTGMRSLEDLATLENAGADLSRFTAWLGLGRGKPALDDDLAARGIETSFGDFRAEAAGSVDYWQMAKNGAEVLSVDDVPAAARALYASGTADADIDACTAPIREATSE